MTPFFFFLDWEANCQFAGLIVAREAGLFAEVGLDVRLVPPSANPDSPILDLVLRGGTCAGCMEDNLIVRAVLAGHPVKAIGATMQDSPMVLMTRLESGIVTLADLAGRRVAMHADGIHLLETVLELHGVDGELVETTVGGWSLDDLAAGRFDAVQGYATTEPHLLARRGVAVRQVPVRHRDLHPWAQMMFAPAAVIEAQRDLLIRFLLACRTGWIAAMTDPGRTAELVAAVSDEHGDAAENRTILEAMVALIAGDAGLDRAGAMDPERWRRNLSTYARFGMICRVPDTAEVVATHLT